MVVVVVAGRSVQLVPPSVDVYKPMPASESADAFGSPVPAYRMLLVASYVRAPIAFVAKLPETNVQFAPLPESALSVRQMPPPAAAAQARHPFVLQFGAIANAVIRPEVL